MMAFRRRKLEQQHEVDKKDHAPVAWKEGSRPDGREGGDMRSWPKRPSVMKVKRRERQTTCDKERPHGEVYFLGAANVCSPTSAMEQSGIKNTHSIPIIQKSAPKAPFKEHCFF